jgi:hypothetical protein
MRFQLAFILPRPSLYLSQIETTVKRKINIFQFFSPGILEYVHKKG